MRNKLFVLLSAARGEQTEAKGEPLEEVAGGSDAFGAVSRANGEGVVNEAFGPGGESIEGGLALFLILGGRSIFGNCCNFAVIPGGILGACE